MVQVMGSGVDSLVLALDVVWKDRRFFDSVSGLKDRAILEDKDCPGVVKYRKGKEKWLFSVRPYGIRGYEWFLASKEFKMRIGNWMEPTTRPSIMVEISSESLWRIGPMEIFERVLDIIEESGGMVKEAKISRADLCIDMMLDSEEWRTIYDFDLEKEKHKSVVSRGKDCGMYWGGKGMKGITVGKGQICARIYDKPKEIKDISKKYWMYDIWGIKEIPKEKRIYRVEFQIRREVIKDLGAGEGGDFFMKIDEVWAYCTKKWLQMKDGYGKEHKLRKPLSWWEVVQEGFLGVQGARPAIRKKAIKVDEKQLRAQLMGLASSLTALTMEKRKVDVLNFKEIEPCMKAVIASQKLQGYRLIEFKENVIRKRAKYSRSAK